MQLEELVRRIRRGDKNAIKELVATYGNAVYQRAFERTQDKELAREAARQTFGQFVAIVQQQPEDDGWSLWFGDLIERNISAYAQISVDMQFIETELEHELYGEQSAAAQPEQPQPPRQPYTEKKSAARASAPVREKAARSVASSSREEFFDEAPDSHTRKRSGQGFTVLVLVLICLLLLWVVGGVAMTMKWIPYYDLGYSWFNASVFRLF